MPSSEPSPTAAPQRAPAGERDLYTLAHAADRLSICRRSLERLISAGVFPRPVKVGSSSRVMHQDIANYLEQLRRERGDKLGTS